MQKEIIRLEGVSKKFGDNFALKNVNLSIKEGETLGIIGLSGSGKSVLIHVLRGYKDYEPTDGRVIYNLAVCNNCYWVETPSKDGEQCPRCGEILRTKELDIWKLDDPELATAIKKRVGIMLQRTFALYSEKSVFENIVEAMESIGVYEGDVSRKALELLKAVNLPHRVLTVARDLSGGEKQRVILARQIAIDPVILLADEPTGTLDPENTRMILRMLYERVKKAGKTMILTSHIPHILEKLSDRIIWLDRGKIVAEGRPDEIIKKFLEQVKIEDIKHEFATQEDILRVKNVKKYYYSVSRGVVKAVDGVTFDVKESEIFGLLGPSGSGKTTLSRLIAGITDVTAGEIYVRVGDEWIDMRVPGITGRGRATPYIGILHQEYALYPYRTVFENLTEAISLDFPSEFARLRAIDVLTGVGFSEEYAEKILEKRPDELSEGEKHRVALAQVIIREPRILILDEPSGTMDPVTKVEVAKTLKKIREEFKTTILVISHDMDFTRLTCDRVALMMNGKILKIGETEEVIDELMKIKMSVVETGEALEREAVQITNIDDSSCVG